jgi:spoIIIJ-associated protein
VSNNVDDREDTKSDDQTPQAPETEAESETSSSSADPSEDQGEDGGAAPAESEEAEPGPPSDEGEPPPEPTDDDTPQDGEPAEKSKDEPAEAKDGKPKSDEPQKPFEEDGRADQALDFVVDVLTKMGMDCTVDLMENDPGDPASDIRVEISGHDAGKLIGKKGQTLAALQFLTNRVVNRPSRPRRHILIDADGYRARREQALSSMAQRLGKEAVSEGKIITFEPMSAQDRRVVHLSLAKSPGLVTQSEGKGATRRVQIIPVRE